MFPQYPHVAYNQLFFVSDACVAGREFRVGRHTRGLGTWRIGDRLAAIASIYFLLLSPGYVVVTQSIHGEQSFAFIGEARKRNWGLERHKSPKLDRAACAGRSKRFSFGPYPSLNQKIQSLTGEPWTVSHPPVPSVFDTPAK